MEKKGQGKKRRRTRKREIAGKEKEEATERQAEPKGNRKFEKEGEKEGLEEKWNFYVKINFKIQTCLFI